jgi:hypothetical protein
MGANQSRPSDAAVNEKLVERLQALQMKHDRSISEKDGFVVVGGEARKLMLYNMKISFPDRPAAPKYTAITKHQQDISAGAVQEWEKELMEDPKVYKESLWYSNLLTEAKESPCSRSPELQLRQRRPVLAISNNLRHAEIQYKDSS